MKYERLSKELFVKNRAKFMVQMKSKSLAVFNSNDIYPVSADGTLPFEQHRDIFYLSGIDQEQSVLVLFPEAKNPNHREILFLKETNAHIAIWEGEKYTKESAFETSGVKTVYWLQDFEKVLFQLLAECDTVYLNSNEHYRAVSETETREDRFVKWFKQKYPIHKTERSNPILQKLRSVKEQEEIDALQVACNITEKGFRRLLGYVKPGVWEYNIEAELMHEFLNNRSKGFAYQPIVASGNNANVLHYIANNKECKSGDLILLDVAAEYANFSADLTRTIPASGKFTKRQKEVYNAVNFVKKEATKLLKPGVVITDYHVEVGEIMTEELLKLNLISSDEVKNEDPKWPAYKKYFMHGTSHFLGLNTHDYGIMSEPIEKNMVFTVEPGIYIPEEGFGIRLEDDVVITDGEPFNLMANIPIEADEIEDLMNQ